MAFIQSTHIEQLSPSLLNQSESSPCYLYKKKESFNSGNGKHFRGKLGSAESLKTHDRCFIFQVHFGSVLQHLSVFYTSGNVNKWLPLQISATAATDKTYWSWRFLESEKCGTCISITSDDLLNNLYWSRDKTLTHKEVCTGYISKQMWAIIIFQTGL